MIRQSMQWILLTNDLSFSLQIHDIQVNRKKKGK